MKLTTTSVLTSIVLSATLSLAAPFPQVHPEGPIRINRRHQNKGQNNGQQGAQAAAGAGAIGAAYVITNGENGNQILSSSIAANGQLTFGAMVNAGGRGVHGITDPNGPDPLFSQGAIKVHAGTQMLATVNSGSNTVSMFSIDAQDPSKLTMVGTPAASGGEFPMSVAFNKAGDMVCVLNSGQVNGVNCYKPDAQKGLVAMANTVRSLGLNQTTPATGPAGTASHLVFNEANTQLVASIKGVPPTPGFLAAWDIAADGSLSQDFTKIAAPAGGLLPFSMTVIPGKNAILATDAGIGFDVFDMSGAQAQQAGAGGKAKRQAPPVAYATDPNAVDPNAAAAVNSTAPAVQAANGAGDRSSAIAIDGQSATCWSSFSPKTGNFYLTDIGTSTVTEVNVDANLKGSIVQQYPQTAKSATIDNDIATIGANDFMYVLAASTGKIDVLSLDAPGQTSNVQSFDLMGPATAAGAVVDPNNLQGMTTFIKK